MCLMVVHTQVVRNCVDCVVCCSVRSVCICADTPSVDVCGVVRW